MSIDAKLEAAEEFVKVWGDSGLGSELIDSYGCTLTCSEADAMANLFEVFGRPGIAENIIEAHTAHDEPEDDHYQEQE